MKESLCAMKVFQNAKSPNQSILTVQQILIAIFRAELRFLISFNMKNYLRAIMWLWSIDKKGSIDGFSRIIGSLIYFNLDLSGVFVAHFL